LEAGGLLFIVLSMLPVSNIFFTVGVTFGERLTYLPLFGFCLLGASLFLRLWKRSCGTRWAQTSVLVISLLLLSFYSTVVVDRDRAWQDADAFTAALVEDSPKSALAHGLRFLYLNEKGTHDAALQHLLRALEIYPAYYDAWDSYGDFLTARGDYEKAVSAYVRAAIEVAKTPYGAAEAGQFYFKAARLDLVMGRCTSARDHMDKAAQWIREPYPRQFQQLIQRLKHHGCEE